MKSDLLIVGGGVIGAGLAWEAVQRGLRVSLVERDDYASGASSKSSKLVHGGLRYLQQGKLGLVRESLAAREQLLRDAPGLVQPMPFWLLQQGLQLRVGLWLYDQLAGRRTRRFASAEQAQQLGLPGPASGYEDATTDDARLTLRLLQESRTAGAQLQDRTQLLSLRRDETGRVRGARLRGADGFERELDCDAVVLCAGAQLGGLAEQAGLALPRLRPLRGSHLLFPRSALPLNEAIAWRHALDGRPVFAYPWLGTTIVGTTDVDQPDPELAPRCTAAERDYLLAALRSAFGERAPAAAQIQCSWAGLRPVLAGAPGTPASKESREHLVLAKDGVVAVAGGKLSTFRSMAQAALQAAAPWLPPHAGPTVGAMLPPAQDGRWGSMASAVCQGERLAGTETLIGEIRHSLQHEQVHHLDDLLLRRTRLGLLQPDFGRALLPALQLHCQELLGWSAERFAAECERYLELMGEQYGAANAAAV
jgi:glycerol-3-phosphate dehydrogenase